MDMILSPQWFQRDSRPRCRCTIHAGRALEKAETRIVLVDLKKTWHTFFSVHVSNFPLKATTSGLTSFDMHSSTRTPMVNGQDTVSPVAPEIQPSPLLPRRPRGPRPQELRKRLTGRCSYVPLLISHPF
jgi:hypothetical protein